MLHIGKLVKAKLKERAHTCVWLAQQMDCSRTNLYKIFNKEYVGSRISPSSPLFCTSTSSRSSPRR